MLYSIQYSLHEDQNLPLRMVYVGARHKLDSSFHPHGNGYYMWYNCLEGDGEFIMEGNRIHLQAGQCIFLLPDTSYSCQKGKNGCKFQLLGFTGNCCKELLASLHLLQPGIYTQADPGLLQAYPVRMQQLYRKNARQPEYSKLCYSFLLDLAANVSQITDLPTSNDVHDSVNLVIEYLSEHYSEPVSLEEISASVHMTKEYLCTLFKKETGRTILQHLTITRIGMARLFLEQYPDKKVYEIGRMCGFESPSYFGKKFLEIVGMTPEHYRRINSIPI